MAFTLDMYKKAHNGITTEGRGRKYQSDMIMTYTFDRDLQYHMGYFYDYDHEVGTEDYLKLHDLHPENCVTKVPVEVKLQAHTSQTFEKDVVTFHILFKPGQQCPLDYYETAFARRYKAHWPIGTYVDLQDEFGIYHRWLCVGDADVKNVNFPTYEVLPCDYVIQWVNKGKKLQMPGVLRSQNNYTSGLWIDYRIQTAQQDQKFAVPMNKITESIFYNVRFCIDAPGDTEPVTWLLSKVHRTSPFGILLATTTQDHFNQHRDYIEKDSDGFVIGLWADYWNTGSTIEPTDQSPPISDDDEPTATYTSVITYSGIKPELKVGGSYKTFTMTYYDAEDGSGVEQDSYNWKYKLDGNKLENTDGLLQILTPAESTALHPNQVKIKFIGGDDYYGSTLTIYNEFTSLDVAIIGM